MLLSTFLQVAKQGRLYDLTGLHQGNSSTAPVGWNLFPLGMMDRV
jgi:hypothetical protein